MSSSQIQTVKDATNIIEVISGRIALQRSGTNWRGLCPFHSEKSPSFFVSEQLQRYKCFGCGETGDVFTFLEKYEGMSFGEALEYLAEQANITLQKYVATPQDDERKKLLEVMDLTAEYYHYLLQKHAVGKAARAYLKQRGITNQTIQLFQLGFAQDSWDGLSTYLTKKKKYAPDLLNKAGLVVTKAGRSYDRFRGRLIFPLKNHRGQIVGFSGRSLDPEAKAAKYINSPETELYHKSELLFGFSELYQEIRKANEVIITEGEFDVLSSAQVHVNNVVAIKGSALTEQHLRLLKRTVDRVILALDADDAGVEATKKAIGLARQVEIEVRVIPLGTLTAASQPKDVDDLARTEPKLWREASKKTVSAYQFLIDQAVSRFDLATPEGMRQVIKEVGPSIATIPHEVEKDFYVKKLAELLHVKQSVIEKDLKKLHKKPIVAGTTSLRTEKQSPIKQLSKRQRIEHTLLGILFTVFATDLFEKTEALAQHQFEDPQDQRIIEKIIKNKISTLESLLKTLAEDQKERVFMYITELEASNQQLDNPEDFQEQVKRLQVLTTKSKIEDIKKNLTKLDAKNNLSEKEQHSYEQLLSELATLQKKLR